MRPGPFPDVAAAREQVATAARRLAAEGLVSGTSGNLSARAADDLVAVTPTGMALAETSAADVALVDLDGRHLDGPLAATCELELHLAVYRRHAVGAVAHTHSPLATSLSCVLDELPCVHYGMLPLGGDVPVAPYRTFGTAALAEVTADALEGKAAALMANHGAVVLAEDPAQAVERALLLEWACRTYHDAARHGTPRRLSPEQQDDVGRVVAQLAYGTPREAVGAR